MLLWVLYEREGYEPLSPIKHKTRGRQALLQKNFPTQGGELGVMSMIAKIGFLATCFINITQCISFSMKKKQDS